MSVSEAAVAVSADNRLGQVALALGFIRPEQLESALQAQAASPVPRLLGQVLVDLGLLTQDQLAKVLDQQLRKTQKEDLSFGKLAVREGLLTVSVVTEILAEQTRLKERGEQVRLGQLCVRRGLLTVEQVQRLLELQRVGILVCDGCLAQYNIACFDPNKKFRCTACGARLRVPERLFGVQAEDGSRLQEIPASEPIAPALPPAPAPEVCATALAPVPAPSPSALAPASPAAKGRNLSRCALFAAAVLGLVSAAFYARASLREQSAQADLATAHHLLAGQSYTEARTAYAAVGERHPGTRAADLARQGEAEAGRVLAVVQDVAQEARARIDAREFREAEQLLAALEQGFPDPATREQSVALRKELDQARTTARTECSSLLDDAAALMTSAAYSQAADLLAKAGPLALAAGLNDQLDALNEESRRGAEALARLAEAETLLVAGRGDQALTLLGSLKAPAPLAERHARLRAQAETWVQARSRLQEAQALEASGTVAVALAAYEAAATVFPEAREAARNLLERSWQRAREAEATALGLAEDGRFVAALAAIRDASSNLASTPPGEHLALLTSKVRERQAAYEQAAAVLLDQARAECDGQHYTNAKATLQGLLEQYPRSAIRPVAEGLLHDTEIVLVVGDRLAQTDEALAAEQYPHAAELLGEVRALGVWDERCDALQARLNVETRARDLLQQGLAALEAGEWREAEELLVESLRLHARPAGAGGLAWARFNLAVVAVREALATGDADTAETLLVPVQELRSSCADRDTSVVEELTAAISSLRQEQSREGVLADIARALQEARYVEVREACDKLLASDPHDTAALKLRARAWIAQTDPARAILDLDAVIGIDPRDTDALLLAAELHLDQGDFAAAEKNLSAFLAFQPDLAVAWNDRGFARLSAGHTNEALEDFRRATDLDPDFANAWANLAAALERMGDPAGTVDAANRALAIQADHAGALANRGLAYYALRKYPESAADFLRITELRPDDVDAWVNLGFAAFAADQNDEAASAWERAVTLDQDLSTELAPKIAEARQPKSGEQKP